MTTGQFLNEKSYKRIEKSHYSLNVLEEYTVEKINKRNKEDI